MKKIMMALMLIGAVSMEATAQSNSKYAKNYKVCRDMNGKYAICDNGMTLSSMSAMTTSGNRVSSFAATRRVSTSAVAQPAVNITEPVSNRNIVTKYSRRSGATVQYEGPNGELVTEPKAPAYGLPSPQYDGPDMNSSRNLNYGSGQPLPPSTGEIR